MLSKHFVFIVILAICILGVTVAPPGAKQVYAGQEDAALFQEALSRYGQWLNYGSYGLVWRPGQVSRDWRPYTNGRWVPTPEGYVFETDEPWGWATYHYGNWLPTRDHGWVWVPGRTWYPHTVNWRTSDENVGWAPVPPPEYTGAEYSDSYPAVGYGSSSGLNSYGSYPYNSLASNWIFTRAPDFLLGWGQPYSSVYSYANTGLILGPQYIPTVYERTVYVTNYVSPSYVANAYYNWGPPLTYITRVTHIKNIEVDRRYKNLHLSHLRNVMPPSTLTKCHPAWRDVLPMTGSVRQGHLRSVPHYRIATGKLNYPDAIPAPASLRPSQHAGRPSANLGANQPAAPGKTQLSDNRQTGGNKSRLDQLNQPAEQSRVPESSRTVINSSNYGSKKKPESLPKTALTPTSTGEPVSQQLPVSPPRRQNESRREFQRVEPPASQENQVRRYQAERLQDQQRADHELKMRQQQRLEMERRQQEAKSHNDKERQARSQQQVQMEQQRRVEMMQQQQRLEMERRQQEARSRYLQEQQARSQQQVQMEQQRQAEKMRQQQMQQQRQAEMQQQQQRQAEIMRGQQLQQQQQIIRHSQPPPQRATAAAPHQKKRDNLQQ